MTSLLPASSVFCFNAYSDSKFFLDLYSGRKNGFGVASQSYGASARCGFRDPGFARSNSYQYRAVYGAVFDEVPNGLY